MQRMLKMTRWNIVVCFIFFFIQSNVVYSATKEQLTSAAETASQWLSDQQLLDGSWGDDDDIKLLYTSEVVLGLSAFNQYQSAYYNGVTWLENHASNNTDYEARRIAALVPHGNNINANIDALLQTTNELDQNLAGWGLSENYYPSAIDTALALLALNIAEDDSDISTNIAFLKAIQLLNGQDNGWSISQESSSHLQSTAQILLSLNRYKDKNFNLDITLNKAANTLLQQVDANTPDLIKGEATLALIRYQGISPAIDALLDSIYVNQNNDGSWGQNPYVTAVNLRVLAAALGTDQDGYADPILIPDMQLRAAINANLNKNAIDAITKGELASVTNLDLSGSGIANLTGLEYAINLETLNLCGNPLESLAPLKNLPPKLANVTYCQDHNLNPEDDTDEDGMPDVWEIFYGFNPLDPSDANEDPDNDGLSNLEEFTLGTDPLVPNPLDELYGLSFQDAAVENFRLYDSVVSPDGRHLYAVSYYSHSLIVYNRNVLTGQLEKMQTLVDGENDINGLQKAMSITMSPDGRHVYVASFEDNSVSYFTRDVNDGKLTLVQTLIDDEKDGSGNIVDGLLGATSVKVSHDGEIVFVTAGVENSLAVFKRNPHSGWLTFSEALTDGKLDSANQLVSGLKQAAEVVQSHDNKSVYVTGLLSNAVAVFNIDPDTKQLLFQQVVQQGGVDDENNVVSELGGPISIDITTDDKYVYVASMFSDALLGFKRNNVTGKLTLIQTLKNGLDDGAGNIISGLTGPSAVTLSSDNQFVYAIGQQDNSLVVFKRDINSGKLLFVQALENGSLDKKNNLITNMQNAQSVTTSSDSLHVYVSSNDFAMVTFERESLYMDTDNDGLLNKIDADDDNDGVEDQQDVFPFDVTESLDTDGDLIGDNADVFANDPAQWFDTDNDGISNHIDLDDDNDTLPDTWELSVGLNLMDPSDAVLDIDADELNNLDEFSAKTNPSLWDTDGDAMPDGWEIQYGLNALWPNADEDPDNDNWVNFVEYQNGTDPLDPDTDGDGVIDSEDLFPLNPDEDNDNDNDGIGDNEDLDDDNDGMPDVWEEQYGFNPFDPSDADIDTDGDGFTNLEEYLAGTDPLDPNSFPNGLMNDFDADGKSDALWYDAETGKTHLWLMDGVTIKEQQELSIPNTWRIAGVGDFNGDKKADIIWRDENSNEFTLWIMDIFTKTQEKLLTKPSVQAVVGGVGDIDGDSKVDIVWHDQQVGTVTVALMNGLTVKEQQEIAANVNLKWRVGSVVDFNNDNKADIRWNEMEGETIISEVHLWIMSGFDYQEILEFAPIGIFKQWNYVVSVFDGDFDGDGDRDLMPISQEIYKQNPPNKISLRFLEDLLPKKPSLLIPNQKNLWKIIAQGDFNDDSHANLLWRYGDTDLYKVWTIDSGVFHSGWIVGAQDTDNDGMPDVWETIHELNPNDPSDANQDLDDDGLINLDEYLYDTYPHDAMTDDDYMSDAWEVQHGLNPLSWDDNDLDLDNDGYTNFEEYCWDTDPNDPQSYPILESYRDFNGDGITDIVWQNQDTGEVEIWMMNGFDVLEKQIIGTFSSNWLLVSIADFDNDNKADLLWHDLTAGTMKLTLMDGFSIKDEQEIVNNLSATTSVVGAGDTDADGRADIVLYDLSAKNATLILMDGFAVKQQQVIANDLPEAWAPGAVGDANHDGKADIFWRDFTPFLGWNWDKSKYSDIHVWLMNGFNITDQQKAVTRSYWESEDIMASGDTNGDGRFDLVMSYDGSARAYHFNGTKYISYKDHFGFYSYPNVRVGRFDGDVKYDLIAYDENGQAKLYLMNGKVNPQKIENAMGENWHMLPLSRDQYDSDNDGMDDHWELKHRLNPLNDDTDAQTDLDGDGFSNFEEYFHNTNPVDQNSFP